MTVFVINRNFYKWSPNSKSNLSFKVTNQNMGLWGSLAILSGLGPDDPGSNPGSPILYLQIDED